LIAAVMSAGDHRAYLWGIAAISIQFIGVIWTPILSMAAAIFSLLVITAAVWIQDPDTVGSLPTELLPVALLLIITAASASSLRSVDHESRGNVLIDGLTGLHNRVAMQQHLASITRTGSAAAVAVLDLDHFKSINDIHGHAVGDAVLVAAATRMEAAIKGVGSLYRYGGEEFVAIFDGTSATHALGSADRLRQAVAGSPIGGLTVTLSAGVAAEHAMHATSGSRIFQQADEAMYRAKDEGRNCVRVADTKATPSQATERELTTVRAREAGTARPLPTRGRGSWLVGSVVQRDQLIAILDGLTPSRVRLVNIVLVLTGVALAPTYGWLPTAVFLLRAIVMDPWFRFSVRMAKDHSLRHETAPLLEAGLSMAFIAVAVAVTSSPALYLLALMAIPAQSVTAAYPFRASVILIAEAAVLSLTAGLLRDPAAIAENPVIVAMPVALVAAVALVGASVGKSAVDHRAAAIIDPLTGLLNRAALDLRLPEITEMATGRNTPVTVVVGDIDHFKKINDVHGHSRGDAVLAAVAERIRSVVRPSDALYRVGGEEFVVLLASTQTGAGAAIAERIRQAVMAEPICGLDVTISLGVAGSPGSSFRYSEAFARADTALMCAKHEGRNRVCNAPPSLRAVAAA
jgi:diguanylate cyclase (GGDEF)-like protein